MVLLNSSIKSDLIFPPDYRIFNVGDNLELKYYDKVEYYKVTNRNFFPFIEKQDTDNWLLEAGADYNAGDISDWLEPSDDELMIMALSLYSDRNMEVRIKLPSSDQRFGTKQDSEIGITPEISPWKKPTVSLYSFGTAWVPAFVIKNPTEYTNLAMKLGITGFRYRLSKLAVKPEVFSTINMSVLKA